MTSSPVPANRIMGDLLKAIAVADYFKQHGVMPPWA